MIADLALYLIIVAFHVALAASLIGVALWIEHVIDRFTKRKEPTHGQGY